MSLGSSTVSQIYTTETIASNATTTTPSRLYIIAGAVVGAVLLTILVVTIILYVRKRIKDKRHVAGRYIPDEIHTKTNIRAFPKFKEEEGGFPVHDSDFDTCTSQPYTSSTTTFGTTVGDSFVIVDDVEVGVDTGSMSNLLDQPEDSTNDIANSEKDEGDYVNRGFQSNRKDPDMDHCDIKSTQEINTDDDTENNRYVAMKSNPPGQIRTRLAQSENSANGTMLEEENEGLYAYSSMQCTRIPHMNDLDDEEVKRSNSNNKDGLYVSMTHPTNLLHQDSIVMESATRIEYRL